MALATIPEFDPSWVREYVPRVLPAGWSVRHWGIDGPAYVSAQGLSVIMSGATELDGKRWLHVSCARRSRLPSWEDLRMVKDLFVGRERMVVQVLPRASEYVNIHNFCLHLWTCLDGDPLPDFTHGSGSL